MDVLLRPATLKDGVEIAGMSRELIEGGLGWFWTPARVAASIRHRDTMVLVAEAQGMVAGFAVMEFGDETAHLNLLAVRPRFQRRGIARRMMEWLEASCRTAGIQVVYLELRAANRGARQFYQSLGYREIARVPRYYGGREMAIRMARDLFCEVAPDR